MSAIYQIKLLDARPGGVELLEYYAKTHPQVGEFVQSEGKSYRVVQVEHALKAGRDGSGQYACLDFVLLMVV